MEGTADLDKYKFGRSVTSAYQVCVAGIFDFPTFQGNSFCWQCEFAKHRGW